MTSRSHPAVWFATMVGLVLAGALGLRAARQAAPAQNPLPPATKVEALLLAPDTLLVKTFYRVSDGIGLTVGVVMDALVVSTQSAESGHASGLRVELKDSAANGHTAIGYVDAEELDGLSRALGQIATTAGQWTGRADARSTDLQFTTLGAVSVGLHQDGREQKGFLQCGVTEPVRRTFDVSEIATLRSAVDQAITVLQGKSPRPREVSRRGY